MKLRVHLGWLGTLASLGWLALTVSALAGKGAHDWQLLTYSELFSWRSQALTEAMVVLDRLVIPSALSCLALFLGYHGAKRQWRSMVALSFVASGGALQLALLKALVGRSRPSGLALVDVSGYSFPSGQVLAVALLAGWAIYVASMSVERKRTRLLVGMLAVSVVLLVSFSRIYLGAHYPGDVVASVLMAMSWLCACIGALNSLNLRGEVDVQHHS